MALPRIHILGGGALGTLFASHFARSRVPTTLLLRPEADALQRPGSRCSVRPTTGSRCTLRVTAEGAEADEQTVDCEASNGVGTRIGLLVLAVKAYAARSALEGVRMRLHESSAVILLCNGALAVADDLPRDTPLLVATTTHGAWARGPRDVHHAGRGTTWIGALPGGESGGAMEAARSHFALHGLGALEESPALTERRLWLKLAANVVLNPLTALWDCQNGEVLRRSEGRAAAQEVCAEVAAVAASLAQHPAPSAAELVDFVHACAAENADNFSSMCMDVRAGRRTEIHELNGWIVRKAQALGLAGGAPACARLVEAILARSPG